MDVVLENIQIENIDGGKSTIKNEFESEESLVAVMKWVERAKGRRNSLKPRGHGNQPSIKEVMLSARLVKCTEWL